MSVPYGISVTQDLLDDLGLWFTMEQLIAAINVDDVLAEFYREQIRKVYRERYGDHAN